MVQTRYKRPYSLRLFFAIHTLLCIFCVVLFAKLGSGHPATVTVLAFIVVLCLLATIFDPDSAYHTKTTLNDGTVVRVKRPFIGFKHLETKVGVTGDYEVRFDGWRHEPALLRIWWQNRHRGGRTKPRCHLALLVFLLGNPPCTRHSMTSPLQRIYNVFSVILGGLGIVLQKANPEFRPVEVNMQHGLRSWMGLQLYFPNSDVVNYL